MLWDEEYSKDCQERWGTEGWALLRGLRSPWDGEGVLVGIKEVGIPLRLQKQGC